MKFADIIREVVIEEWKYFENYLKYAELIKKLSADLLGDVEVYIFGSIVKKKNIHQQVILTSSLYPKI